MYSTLQKQFMIYYNILAAIVNFSLCWRWRRYF